jgi:hypothetical protein
MGKWVYGSTLYSPRHYLEMSSQLHGPCRFNPGENAPGTCCIGGWVGLIAGLDDMEK